MKYSDIVKDLFCRLLRSIFKWNFFGYGFRSKLFFKIFHNLKEILEMTTTLKISTLMDDMIQLSKSWSWHFHAVYSWFLDLQYLNKNLHIHILMEEIDQVRALIHWCSLRENYHELKRVFVVSKLCSSWNQAWLDL